MSLLNDIYIYRERDSERATPHPTPRERDSDIVPTDTNYRNVEVSTCRQNMELGFDIEAQHV